MARERREIEDDEDEGESYLSSYADLITDMMAIFVLLFSFAMMNQAAVSTQSIKKQAEAEAKIKQAEAIIQEYENETEYDWEQEGEIEGEIPEEQQAFDVNGDPLPSALDVWETFNDLFEAIRAYIKQAGLEGVLSLTRMGDNMLLIRVKSSVLFETGSADVNPDTAPLMDKIAEILLAYKDFITQFRIEGHTDDIPIKNKQFDSNWELSSSRAVNVLRQLLDLTELPPSRFSAVGYGEFSPIADNDTEDGRSQNRRVDFIIETRTVGDGKTGNRRPVRNEPPDQARQGMPVEPAPDPESAPDSTDAPQ